MIGVFDSGSGGLTVVRALADRLPERSFLYFGDHARAPYGERTAEEIFALTRDGVARLFGAGCRLVVLACNTAAATSLRPLQRGWLAERHADKRVLGVLVPTVEAVTGLSWQTEGAVSDAVSTVAVFATPHTVRSRSYPAEIAKRAPGIRVVQQACPSLAGLIEAHAPRAELRAAVAGYVAAMMERLEGRPPDVVMLGCTHYPLVADLFAEALPAGVGVLSQPRLVADSLAAYLGRHADIDRPDGPGGVRFLTSGDPEPASVLASAFFGRPVRFSPVR